jgi:hydrogenase nickel incorporation protein HypA/HybF
MHEASIVESLLALAVENAERAQAKRIVTINVVVGELSGVVEDPMEFYFGFLSKGTIAAGATLSFRRIAAQLRCRKCDRVFTPEKLDLHCPDCGETEVDIVAGRELYIDSLEVE